MRIYLPINHWMTELHSFWGKKHVLQLIGWVIHLKHTLTRFRWVYIIFSRFQAEKKTSTWNMYISIHDSSQKNHRLLLTYTSTSHGPVGKHMSHKKKTYYFPLCWLFNRDPYNGLLWSLYIWVGFHPLKTLNNQVFFSLLTYSHAFSNEGIGCLWPWNGTSRVYAVAALECPVLQVNGFCHCDTIFRHLQISGWLVVFQRLTSWWFQPIWKILVKMGIFPK